MKIPPGVQPAQLSWKAQIPCGTAVEFQVRSAESIDLLAKAPWRGSDGDGSRFKTAPARLTVPPDHKALQYRAILTSPDGGSTPRLTSVEISGKSR